MSEENIPHALWAKVDLILDKVQRTELAVARIEGDTKVQNQVMQHSTDMLRELKEDTKDKLSKHELRLVALEDLKNKLLGFSVSISLVTGIITALVVAFIKSMFERH